MSTKATFYDLEDGELTPPFVKRQPTAESVSIPPDLFEKLYLPPKTRVSHLPSTFANPSPIAVAGFLIALTPLTCTLFGWRGAGHMGAANIGTYLFGGGLLDLLGGLGEYFLGNTFSATVFMSFGAFWLAFGTTLIPSSHAYAPYASHPSTAPDEGLSAPGFQSTFAFFLVAMAILCLVFCVASLRTNVVFFSMFLLLPPTFACLAGSFWHSAEGNVDVALRLQRVAASLCLVVDVLGWYIFIALILESVDLCRLPVVDLSQRIKGASQRVKQTAGEI